MKGTTSIASPTRNPAVPHPSVIARHPVGTLIATSLVGGWLAFGIPLIIGAPLDPSKLGVTLVLLFGGSLVLSSRTGGRAAVRQLLAGVTKWRIGMPAYGFVLFAMPLATISVALTTGTLRAPAEGWGGLALSFLLSTVVVGALVLNLWEETAWAGFVQSRLMARRGLLVGSVMTAIPFVGIHLPLVFEEHGLAQTTWSQAAFNLAVMSGMALFFRYLAGVVFLDTAGSILAVGLLHASFNASMSLSAVDSWWQSTVALILLAGAAALYRSLPARRSVNKGRV